MFEDRNDRGHLSDRELLLLHDGELPRRAAKRARKHLEACWSCRSHSEHIRNTVLRFVDYCNQAGASLGEPPNHWNGFERRLSEYANQVRQETGARQPKPWRQRVAAATAPVLNPRFLTIAALIVCLLDGFFFDQTVPAARAMELLSRADYREAQSFATLPNPVVHQRLRLTSRGRQAHWELWRSIRGTQLESSWTGDDRLKSEFLKVYSANGWDMHRPLSPATLLDWQERVNGSVTEFEPDKERDRVSIRFTPGLEPAPNAAGAITGISLTLTGKGLHAIEQSLDVSTREGDREFQLQETAYDVVRYSETPFARATVRAAKHAAPLPARPEERKWSDDELENAEAQLRFTLHRLRVDLELTPAIRRAGNGIELQILVDSEARQQEIMAAVAGLPQVRAQVWTPENAPHLFREQVIHEAGAPQTIHRTRAALVDKLVACLGSWQSATDYIDRVHRGLRSAMVPALALERLIERYPEAEYHRVPDAGRALLDQIAMDYLKSIQTSSTELKSDLVPALQACQFSNFATRTPAVETNETWCASGRQYAHQLREIDAAFNLLFTTQESTASPFTTAEAVRRLSDLCASLGSKVAGASGGEQPLSASGTR